MKDTKEIKWKRERVRKRKREREREREREHFTFVNILPFAFLQDTQIIHHYQAMVT